jgi:hypothetical protein
MTARINTIIQWWRSPPPDDLADLVEVFVRNPVAVRSSPRHRLGETFERRSRSNHLSIDHITALASPEGVALDLGLPVLALTRLTADAEPGTVALPDPGFAPMVAAHLAARVAASALPQPERLRLLAAILPVAPQDVTQLDQVFGRLLCVDPDLGADELAVAALLEQPVTREPTGAWFERAW